VLAGPAGPQVHNPEHLEHEPGSPTCRVSVR
jgi:hypothetical protein